MDKSHKKSFIAGLELLLIIITVVSATYAWFNNNRELENDDITLKTDSHFNLLISLDGGDTWITESSLNLPGDFEFKYEITGNGVNMYIPSNKRDDGTPVSFTTATSGRDYLDFNVMFRLSANASIFLDRESYVLPALGSNPDNLIGPDVERLSIGGEFTRDLIASSVRIAFIENSYINGEYILGSSSSMVWAPNKNYEITCTDMCNASIDSSNVQEYKYIEASSNPVVEQNVNSLRDEINASGQLQNAFGDPILTTIDTNENNGIKKLTVRIWIEGNDRDNVTALTGGLFQMNLKFAAIDKIIDNIPPQVSIGNNNTIDGIDTTMEYSTNGGINWVSYDENNSPTFNEGDKVNVRKKETLENFASSAIELTF